MIKDANRIHKWPGYIPPEKDELLSSWIIRLIRAHYTRPFTFSEHYFNGYNILARDMDKYLPDNILNLISEYSYLSIDDVKSLQLTSYKYIIYENDLESNFLSGITNLGIYHRTKKHNGLLICGSCINKNTYFKKSWRLVSSIMCVECNSYLIDHCPNCQSPIDFQRHSIGRQTNYISSPLYLCWKCEYDYRQIYIPVTSKNHLKYQLYIDKTIEIGYNKHASYAFLYFKILFLILQRFRTKTGAFNRIHIALVSEFNLSQDIISQVNYSSYQLSKLSLRIEILPIAYYLLENWPIRFIKFCKKYKIRYSDFSSTNRTAETLPFWFQQAFIEF